MSVLTKASTQWMTRPDDERFGSLDDLVAHFHHQKEISRQETIHVGQLSAAPLPASEDESRKSLVLLGADETPSLATHYSFGQLTGLVKAPAKYLRTLPAPMVADLLNHGFRNVRNDDIGTLVRRNGSAVGELAAATGPQYGRIFNYDVANAVRNKFGDGVTGDFRAPGIFGKALDITDTEEYRKQACFFGSDRDMFIFLCDEQNRIEVPNRRAGQPGSLARGFFFWNSEVGATSLGMSMFLFDYVCMNRMVWGVDGYQEIRIRHSSGAPMRWVEEVVPAIEAYTHASEFSILDAIDKARAVKFDDKDAVDKFLSDRFTENQAQAISLLHFAEEARPIENLYDATNAITAYARELPHQNERVSMERVAGSLMAKAAK